MMDTVWPALRPFLAIAVMLAAMWEPGNKKQSRKYEKEDWIDAEYETLD